MRKFCKISDDNRLNNLHSLLAPSSVYHNLLEDDGKNKHVALKFSVIFIQLIKIITNFASENYS
jgi:hypothetical protein